MLIALHVCNILPEPGSRHSIVYIFNTNIYLHCKDTVWSPWYLCLVQYCNNGFWNPFALGLLNNWAVVLVVVEELLQHNFVLYKHKKLNATYLFIYFFLCVLDSWRFSVWQHIAWCLSWLDRIWLPYFNEWQ